ncbi:UdgX family uracil-DNA binding protein [Kaistia sp. MMO-174]|uniref:UdgX family uracil-DNA binding protein n=1 Tax=Kaistia sp. MMO-174 TaxID=3081256 RepID=UPI003017EDE4
MHRIALAGPTDFEGWRDAARRLARQGVDPAEVVWSVAGESVDLFGAVSSEPTAAPPEGPAFAVPRGFLDLAETAILHADPERFALLYKMLCRIRTDHDALEDSVDPLNVRLNSLARAVRRDIHKMHAFVRFRAVETEAGECFIAWFEPEHHIVEAAAPFFVRRFASMRWSILTPERSVHWDGEVLRFSEGVDRSAAPGEDALEDLWRRYYAAIFNPARLKVQAMMSEMPRKYWRNLPEASLIKPLIDQAERRSAEMVQSAATPENPRPQRPAPASPAEAPAAAGSIEALRDEAAGCRRCPLWASATQTVFGEGPEDAGIVFVGEQPGDQEDLAGRPFVGPAGQVFDAALREAGIDRTRVYVTNAVKHFKFVPRGKRRLHQKPDVADIVACHDWLAQELAILRPRLVVALGLTAVRSLTGKTMTLASAREQLLTTRNGATLLATIHPSFLLRLPDQNEKAREYARFLDDLKRVAALAQSA